ncbi:TPA: glycosyltransferase [Candidatus Micrarchaeota archaeon]|nr:glycosyltransferase [Candidatus Micrarchaeota archaeon]
MGFRSHIFHGNRRLVVPLTRACVVHSTLNSVGGGERVCLAVIEALKKLGYEVALITAEPTDWDRVKEMVGHIIKPDKEIHVFPIKVRLFGIYLRSMTFLKSARAGKKCNVIVNTHGDFLPVPSDIVYMHYPTFSLLRETHVNVKYSKSLFWRMYFIPYERIQGRLAKKAKSGVLLTNSEYSRKAIMRHLNTNAIVLHPPVDVSRFAKIAGSGSREERVVLCGRYTPEKNYEFALMVARELPHVGFTIVGACSGKVSNAYYAKLVKLKEKLKLKNVELLRDVPARKQLELYSRSKVLLHAMIGEHFGIAVVEGMAAGLVPVVHKSGGPWLDVLDRGRYGFGYSSLDEAVEAVERALKSYNYHATKAVERAKVYSKDRFIKAFTEIVKRLVSA